MTTYQNQGSGMTGPAQNVVEITPHDTNEIVAGQAMRGVYVGVAGDITVVTNRGSEATFKAFPAGQFVPVVCVIVKATGTTAEDLVGVY